MKTRDLITMLEALGQPDAQVRLIHDAFSTRAETFGISEVRTGFNSVDGRTTYLLVQSEVNVVEKPR